MIIRALKVYKINIVEVRHIPTKKDPSIVVVYLHVDMFNEQSEQLTVNPYQISQTMDSKPLYGLFKVPTKLPLDAFVGQEGYAEVLEMLQLNNTITRNIKRFINEQEYQKLLHLNDQPSPTPVSEEELATFKKQALEKAEQIKIAKEKCKQEEASKPKSSNPNKKSSRKAVKAFAVLMQKQNNKKKKELSFKGNLIEGFIESACDSTFEQTLARHNKGYTKAGAIGSYIILQAKKECQYKNGISVKDFK